MMTDPESQSILKKWCRKVDADFTLSLLGHDTDGDYRWLQCLPENWNLAKVSGLMRVVSIAIGQLLKSCSVCEPMFHCSSCSIFLLVGGSCLHFCINDVKWPQPSKCLTQTEISSCPVPLHSLWKPGTSLPFC